MGIPKWNKQASWHKNCFVFFPAVSLKQELVGCGAVSCCKRQRYLRIMLHPLYGTHWLSELMVGGESLSPRRQCFKAIQKTDRLSGCPLRALRGPVCQRVHMDVYYDRFCRIMEDEGHLLHVDSLHRLTECSGRWRLEINLHTMRVCVCDGCLVNSVYVWSVGLTHLQRYELFQIYNKQDAK